MLPLGTLIDDRYRLDRVLGSGGMGVVFAATHLGLGRQVALKVVRPDLADGSRPAERLLREARTVATLRSRHVAQVIDVGMHEGAPFLVMELLDGRTLQDIVGATGPLAVEHAVDLVVQACHALDEAHRRGIVHRDVKPSNLFLATDELKVIDFGISKRAPGQFGESAGTTTDGTLLGSPSFMSPEQIRSSSEVDGRTDIWSLGVVLHYLLTADKPFKADSLLDLMTLIVHEPAPSLVAARPDVPQGLAAVVAKCLEKRREDRYGSAGEVARALAPFASRSFGALAASIPVDSAASVVPRSTPVTSGRLDGDVTATGTVTATMAPPLLSRVPRRVLRQVPWRIVAGLVVLGLATSSVLFFGRGLRRAPAIQAAATAPEAAAMPSESPAVAPNVRVRESAPSEPAATTPRPSQGARPPSRPRSRPPPRPPSSVAPPAPATPAKPELPSTPD